MRFTEKQLKQFEKILEERGYRNMYARMIMRGETTTILRFVKTNRGIGIKPLKR